jgi:hypothetical protein
LDRLMPQTGLPPSSLNMTPSSAGSIETLSAYPPAARQSIANGKQRDMRTTTSVAAILVFVARNFHRSMG